MCNSRNKIYYNFCYYPLMYLISIHDFTYVPIYFGDSPLVSGQMGNPSTLLYGENCPVRTMSLASDICRVVIICKTVYDS